MGSNSSKPSKRSKRGSKNHANFSRHNVSRDNENEVIEGSEDEPALVDLTTRPRICLGCNTEIWHGGLYKSSLGAFWHPECFCCQGCHRPISNYEFIPCGSYFFHKSCYNHFPRCDVCKQSIPQPYGFGGVHKFWNQIFCTSHEDDGTPRCCSCERKMPRHTSFNLEENRDLCLECLDTATMDSNQAQPIYIDILRIYEGQNMKLHQQIPLELVGRQEMREAHDDSPGQIDAVGHCQVRKTGKSNPRIEVTRILVLFGLPRLYTGMIIAHEVMHAWLAQEGYPALDQTVEEGICDVMACMWLETELSSLSSSDSVSPYNKRKLGEFLMHLFEEERMPHAYIAGFRQGQEAVRRYGLKRTLKHIHKTENFPS